MDNSFNSDHFPLNFLTTKQGTPNLEGMYMYKVALGMLISTWSLCSKGWHFTFVIHITFLKKN